MKYKSHLMSGSGYPSPHHSCPLHYPLLCYLQQGFWVGVPAARHHRQQPAGHRPWHPLLHRLPPTQHPQHKRVHRGDGSGLLERGDPVRAAVRTTHYALLVAHSETQYKATRVCLCVCVCLSIRPKLNCFGLTNTFYEFLMTSKGSIWLFKFIYLSSFFQYVPLDLIECIN